ncbi:beta-1,6-N-acetylglucosaminyltransferase [Sediminibacterium sp. C3]|uniref:beta-1,6-N-acetylglucosaminyltransferase n=1 Tax=Sediminibacterium sp. C3 TaxID=1267211 RepID=UPI0004181DF5|nr:beta-1,6-N-acetylglucosaminyltransferase [Sediminibacterium sp. C3]
MVVAHLILVHSKPGQLMRLVKKLVHSKAFFFIHVDAKTDILPFRKALEDVNGVYFVDKRVDIQWATYSMVEATVNGFEAIVASGLAIDYVNLLSGQDYPIQPVSKFHDFLKMNPGKAFMQCLDIETEWTEAISRVRSYHLTHWSIPGKYKFQKALNLIMPRRKLPENLIPVGRSQWFTITLKHVVFIIRRLETNPAFSRFFSYSWAPDEIIFQTLLYNSTFRSDIVNDNLRYIDWSEGLKNPKMLTKDDLPSMMQSGCFFARKFAENDEVLSLIDAKID